MQGKAYVVARALVRSGALKFGSFRLKSGVTSPYYIDLTWLLSSPEDFECVVNMIAEEVESIASLARIDKLASIELKGALILPSVASRLKMPCIIVRKESKSYGLTGRIVGGEVKSGDQLVFFDELVTDGRSKLEGIKPLEEAGGKIETILVVVDREQGGKETLEKMGYQLKAVATITDIVKSLLESKELPTEQAEEILKYVKESRAI